jgi:hypothetical protein
MKGSSNTSSQARKAADARSTGSASTIAAKPARQEPKHDSAKSTGVSPCITQGHSRAPLDDNVTTINDDSESSSASIVAEIARLSLVPAVMEAEVDACSNNHACSRFASLQKVEDTDTDTEGEDDFDILDVVRARLSLAGTAQLKSDDSVETKSANSKAAALSTVQPTATGEKCPPKKGLQPPRQGQQVEPGAYMDAPGEELQRTIVPDLTRFCYPSPDAELGGLSDASVNSEPAHSEPAMEIHERHLAEANPVFEDAEDGTMMHAHPVDINELLNRQLKRKKQRRCYAFALILVFLAGVLIAGSVAGTHIKKEWGATQIPAAHISMDPSAAPSSAPTGVLDFFFWDLPLGTQSSILNGNTPQKQAWEWLSKHQNITNLPDWRRKQLFALAAFFFAFEGEHWNPLMRERWMDDTKEECLWYSSGFGRFVEGEYLEWSLKDDGEYLEWSLKDDGFPQVDSCNSLGQFTNLELANLQLSGLAPSIPPEISVLSALKAISLYDNGIEGLNDMLPAEIYQMTHLRWLMYDQNAFDGNLASELGLLTNLTYLFFAKNSLSGHICSELGEMASLVELELGNNSFSGSLPSELGRLSHLNMLWLQNLPLLTGSIPSELSLLTSLGYLNITGSTGLSGTIPDELCYLQNASCTYLDYWGQNSSCTLDFDCTPTLCGCGCPCASESLVVGTRIDVIPCEFC